MTNPRPNDQAEAYQLALDAAAANADKTGVQVVSAETLAAHAPCKACNGQGGFTYTNDNPFLLQPLWKQCKRCNGTKHEPLIEVAAPASAHCPSCNGAGEVGVYSYVNGSPVLIKMIYCPDCDGETTNESCNCPDCEGRGYFINGWVEEERGGKIWKRPDTTQMPNCKACNGTGKLPPAQAPAPAHGQALETLAEILQAVQESVANGYDAKTLARWVAGLTDTAIGQLGGQRMTPDQFDSLLGKKGANNG